ncbi:hypothetical protein AB0D74_02335 [Streptomyces sp. NPDC048278]|uniref:hypothetical protein n=1 Tax=unclassified Streptomyces TaxID=2593676 RepID=UPI00343F1F63
MAYDVLLDGLGCTRPGQGFTPTAPNCATAAGESAPGGLVPVLRAQQPALTA